MAKLWKECGAYTIGAKLFLAFGIVGCSPEEWAGEREFHDVSVVGLAPGPDSNQESIVQVYAARSYELPSRLVSVHTWLAFRQKGQEKYQVYEAHRFRPHLTGRALRTCRKDYPDRRWHGADPTLLFEIRGALADQAIPAILDAAAAYEDRYRLWPGPNSNSLVAALAREVAELRVDLPPTAIGKDYIPGGGLLARSPSGTGWQVSFWGALGVLVAAEEGIEINIFGAVFGLDLNPPALKLPVVGRLGLPQGRRPNPSDLEKLQHIPPEKRCH